MRAAPSPAGLRLIERPREVEASLWRRLRFEDNRTCREVLFGRYLALARILARHEFRRRPAYGLERSDFEQLAYGGLLEAIDRYDPLHGAHFVAFARRRIRGAIADGLSKSSENGAVYAYRRRAEADRVRSLSPGSTESASDPIVELSNLVVGLAIGFMAEEASLLAETSLAGGGELTAYDSIAWRELQLSVLKEIDQLPEAERTVLQHHYLHGVSFTDIAGMMGLSKGRISQIHRAALARVRQRLQPPD